jgi:hypothetical protein
MASIADDIEESGGQVALRDPLEGHGRVGREHGGDGHGYDPEPPALCSAAGTGVSPHSTHCWPSD